MGDTSAVSNSNVVWTSLIAYIVLKEKLHWLDLVAIPLTLGYFLKKQVLKVFLIFRKKILIFFRIFLKFSTEKLNS